MLILVLFDLFVGAVINALGAIALGAPVGIHHLPKTINWSLMMSLFTFVPAASVFGSSWTDWQRIFGYTKYVVAHANIYGFVTFLLASCISIDE